MKFFQILVLTAVLVGCSNTYYVFPSIQRFLHISSRSARIENKIINKHKNDSLFIHIKTTVYCGLFHYNYFLYFDKSNNWMIASQRFKYEMRGKKFRYTKVNCVQKDPQKINLFNNQVDSLAFSRFANLDLPDKVYWKMDTNKVYAVGVYPPYELHYKVDIYKKGKIATLRYPDGYKSAIVDKFTDIIDTYFYNNYVHEDSVNWKFAKYDTTTGWVYKPKKIKNEMDKRELHKLDSITSILTPIEFK